MFKLLVRESKLVHCLQNFAQVGLFVSQQLTGQLLEDESDVVQDDRVLFSEGKKT